MACFVSKYFECGVKIKYFTAPADKTLTMPLKMQQLSVTILRPTCCAISVEVNKKEGRSGPVGERKRL